MTPLGRYFESLSAIFCNVSDIVILPASIQRVIITIIAPFQRE